MCDAYCNAFAASAGVFVFRLSDAIRVYNADLAECSTLVAADPPLMEPAS